MKKNIYILDEYLSSQKNGIGTYVNEFIYSVKNIETNVCVVIFNANIDEFRIECKNGIRMMLFPVFQSENFLCYPEIIMVFFKLYISDSCNNYFFVNHSPCSRLLRMIREMFPLSKLVFTIHDFGWTNVLMGDYDKYKHVIKTRENLKTKEKYGRLLVRYNEEKIMYDIVDRVVCLSQETKELLMDIYALPSSKVQLIPNGLRDRTKRNSSVDKMEIKRKLLIDEKEKIVLYVGRLTVQKGINILLKAFEKLIDIYPNIRLVIVGPYYAKLEQILYKVHYGTTHITYTGTLNNRELSMWYSIADIGIIPSFYEQCSYVGIEMLMYGLPIVTTDGYGIRSMFQNHINSVVASIGKRNKSEELVCNLIRAVVELMESNRLSEEIKENARKVYCNYYSIGKMRKGYNRLLNSL